MKAYVITTGLIFVLLVIAHIARVAVEGLHLAKEPFFVIATLVPAGLSVWSWRVLAGIAQSKTSDAA